MIQVMNASILHVACLGLEKRDLVMFFVPVGAEPRNEEEGEQKEHSVPDIRYFL
jgi:hypothetical protein